VSANDREFQLVVDFTSLAGRVVGTAAVSMTTGPPGGN